MFFKFGRVARARENIMASYFWRNGDFFFFFLRFSEPTGIRKFYWIYCNIGTIENAVRILVLGDNLSIAS